MDIFLLLVLYFGLPALSVIFFLAALLAAFFRPRWVRWLVMLGTFMAVSTALVWFNEKEVAGFLFPGGHF